MTDGKGVFDLPAVNVLVAGGGGIGAALVEELLQRSNVARVVCLQRSAKTPMSDPRCESLSLDVEDADSVAAAMVQVAARCDRLHLAINTVGMLHNAALAPEKRVRDVSQAALHKLFAVNAAFLPAFANGVSALMRHDEPAVLASLSARVGSIGDNQMGGWHSYRASKAAHNMLLRCIAQEWKISHRNACVTALHPGTVATPLSTPYTPANYSRRVLQPGESARALLHVLSQQRPADTGSFLDWQGKEIPW
jgi:NAD(P)-dependent dehydrogenase (short-subunit alcohol dehydrogenase family)